MDCYFEEFRARPRNPEKLFGSEDNNTVATAKKAMAQRASLLDSIKEQAASLQRQVGAADRERIEQYFTSIRDLEERIKVEGGSALGLKHPGAPAEEGHADRERLAGQGFGRGLYAVPSTNLISSAVSPYSSYTSISIWRSKDEHLFS
jgi:hypothetical protein